MICSCEFQTLPTLKIFQRIRTDLYFALLYFFIMVYLIPYIAQTIQCHILGYAAIFLKNYQVSFEVKVKQGHTGLIQIKWPSPWNMQTPNTTFHLNSTRLWDKKYKWRGGGGPSIYTFNQANCITNTWKLTTPLCYFSTANMNFLLQFWYYIHMRI